MEWNDSPRKEKIGVSFNGSEKLNSVSVYVWEK